MLLESPTLTEVEATLRRALYGRSPMSRALAEAQLITWGLPVEPKAIVLAARRELFESVADTN